MENFVHDGDVQRYRDNTTDKCPREILSASRRAGIEFGSAEYYSIGKTCTFSGCLAKYHWCPTCCLAPRCDCRMPHMSPMMIPVMTPGGPVFRVSWKVDQLSMIDRLGKIPCDDRYGALVLSVKYIAQNKMKSPFCRRCTTRIQSSSDSIEAVFGRTYLEQAHHLWRQIGLFMCADCIKLINGFPCLHMEYTCPSMHLELITPRLVRYVSRRSGEITVSRESTQISSIRSILTEHNNANPPASGQTSSKHGAAPKNTRRSEKWTEYWQSPDGPIKQLPNIEQGAARV
jgi:hypothetical protein